MERPCSPRTKTKRDFKRIWCSDQKLRKIQVIKTLRIEQKHPENKLVLVIYSLNEDIREIIAAEETLLSK